MMTQTGVAIFGPEQLAAIIRDTLPPANEDHSLAVVLAPDQTGATFAVGFTKTDNHGGQWELDAAYRHTWAGDNIVGGKLVYLR